ncbi:MAG: alpha/beta hydrolase fold domain-containing protein [Sphingomonadales bacterium]|nr:alpha/beta hydrolase fold domain-containing protein [Sphingomonadales bacterium]
MTMPPAQSSESEDIDGEIQQFISAIQAETAKHPHFAELAIADQRAILEAVRHPWSQGGPEASREDVNITGPAGRIPIRIIRAQGAPAPQPALVYFHGGGFTFFSTRTHDRVMREYAARSGAAVIGVDYALSPEAKFPVALNEAVAVIDQLAETGAEFGIDPERIAVGGDSAGANLALAASLILRDRGDGSRVRAMLLNYGFFDADFSTASHRRHGGPGEILTTDELAGYLHNYVGGTPHGDHPLVLPIRAELHDLPPSFHAIAQCDPLADGIRAMVAKMEAAGNDVSHTVYEGATHSFLEAVAVSRIADRAFDEASAWLRGHFSGPR